MNCEQYQEQISQFADGELSPHSETGLFIHIGACESCRAFFKDVISLGKAIAVTKHISVPISLDLKVQNIDSFRSKKFLNFHAIKRFKDNRYSLRTIGLAVMFSAFISILASLFFFNSHEPQQTIVCLTPLPEVEINGYIVVAPTITKGFEQ
jgi:hypothetical protein